MQNDFNTFSDETLWISTNDRMPDRCCTCGMFTDRRVPAVYKDVSKRTVNEGNAGTLIALGCLLHFLGPIGWILAWFLSRDSKPGTKTKDVTKKHKIKISQCRLCAAQQVIEPVRFRQKPLRMEFAVHPSFRRGFEEANSNPEVE